MTSSIAAVQLDRTDGLQVPASLRLRARPNVRLVHLLLHVGRQRVVRVARVARRARDDRRCRAGTGLTGRDRGRRRVRRDNDAWPVLSSLAREHDRDDDAGNDRAEHERTPAITAGRFTQLGRSWIIRRASPSPAYRGPVPYFRVASSSARPRRMMPSGISLSSV